MCGLWPRYSVTVFPMAAADGSWDLTIFITDVNVEKTIRTRGDLHVGGLMLKLVNAVGKSKSSDRTAWHYKAGSTGPRPI